MEQPQPPPAPVSPVSGGNESGVDCIQGTLQQEEVTSQHEGNNSTNVIPAEDKPMEAKVQVGS